jgi:hypothetical protein
MLLASQCAARPKQVPELRALEPALVRKRSDAAGERLRMHSSDDALAERARLCLGA